MSNCQSEGSYLLSETWFSVIEPWPLEDSVWDYIREKDKAALEEGAFMETFAGKAVETTVYVLCFLIILWEIYLNTFLVCNETVRDTASSHFELQAEQISPPRV